MSWAAVAKRRKTPIKRIKSPILVTYNIPSEPIYKAAVDDIPRHKENTPDPADDFLMTNGDYETSPITNNRECINDTDADIGWIDYTESSTLQQFKQTLPISIQCIIEFANDLYRNGRVIDLEFEEIEKDLQFQHSKWNGNPELLKKVYFNYNPNKNFDYTRNEEYDERYVMFFGTTGRYNHGDNITLIHYLFGQMSFQNHTEIKWCGSELKGNRIKVIKQLLQYLKLLIQHDILNVNDLFEEGITVWERIKGLAQRIITKRYWDQIVGDIVDDIVDLIASCDKQDAILNILDRTKVYDDNYPTRWRLLYLSGDFWISNFFCSGINTREWIY